MIRVPDLGRPAAASRRTLWLVSLTDLVSLLLAFFVLMVAMGRPDEARWREIAHGISARSTAPTPSDTAPDVRAPFNAATLETQAAINLDYLGALLASQVREQPDLKGIAVWREDDRVVIALPGERLFPGGGLVLGEDGRRALFLLGDVVGRIGNRIEIVGHAARERGEAPLAWERSLTRAVMVAAALRQTGYRRDLVARGVWVPSVARVEQGQRVDIVIRDRKDGSE